MSGIRTNEDSVVVTVPERWDYYITEVDELPASVAVDLALNDHWDELGLHTLYVLQVGLQDPGPDSTGAPAEADLLHSVEKAVVYEAWQYGLRFIGRIRNSGHWQITFMGRSGLRYSLQSIANTHVGAQARGFVITERADPDWSFYRGFLFPDAEQLQWMKDRHVTDALQLHGDTLTIPRRIDHLIEFDDPRNRNAFRLQVEALGFGSTRADGFALRVFRTDSVRLEQVHVLSQQLSELAVEYKGRYQGWETRLVRTPANPANAFLHSLRGSTGRAAQFMRMRSAEAKLGALSTVQRLRGSKMRLRT